MQNLTPNGINLVNDISSRYNLSHDAVIAMMIAVNNGGGSMAQFNCPELGGSGQWMQGGMTMVGDMFNNGLKSTVDSLCSELSNALAVTEVFPPIPQGAPGSNQWWPIELGTPFSSGAQNNTRYAIFPQRLAIDVSGQVTVYDTLDNNIGGVSQQQGGDNSLTFSSQYGTIAVSSLPIVSSSELGSGPEIDESHQTNFLQPAPPVEVAEILPDNEALDAFTATPPSTHSKTSANSIIELIDQLAHLHAAGTLTDDEFSSKKSELLSRL